MICFLVGLNAFKLHTLVFQIHSFCYLHLQGSVAQKKNYCKLLKCNLISQ